MAVNIWNAGTDRMLEGLARREALARQAQLDQQNAERQAAQLALQQENLGLNRMQVEAQIANTRADNERAAAQQAAQAQVAASAAKKAARDEEQVAALIDMYQSTEDPAARERIAMNLEMQGVRVPQRSSQADTRSLQVQANDLLAKGDVDGYNRVLKVIRETSGAGRAPDTGGGGGSTFRDNPRLPQGTKAWIDSIAQRGIPVEQARRELSQGWGQQRSAHPNAELAEAAKYLDSLYPDGAPLVQPEQGALPAPAAEAPLTGTGPEDEAVIAALTEAGWPITPANIAAAKAQLGAATPAAPPARPAAPTRTPIERR